MRLDKFLANSGVGTRSEVKRFIKDKRVKVNGEIVSQKDIENMRYIIENMQTYGDDIDPNDVMILDNVLYEDEQLEIYYLWAEENKFDPINDIKDLLEKLLMMIQQNFNRDDIKIKI